MPELPEVETTKNAILPFKGKTLKRIIVNNPSLRWPIDEKLINKIKDVKVLSISRRAKYIFLNLLVVFPFLLRIVRSFPSR